MGGTHKLCYHIQINNHNWGKKDIGKQRGWGGLEIDNKMFPLRYECGLKCIIKEVQKC